MQNQKKDPSLGNTAKSTTPPLKNLFAEIHKARASITIPEGIAAKKIERFALQSMVRECMPESRTSHCLRTRIKGCSHVAVKWSKKTKNASYANLQTCASLWTCPVCAAKISEHRRKELIELVKAHRDTGGTVLLVTRTFPHQITTPLKETMQKMAVAETKYKSGDSWKLLKANFNLVGTVRSIECTYGRNGFHPHCHELMFFKGTVNIPNLKQRLFNRWHSACIRAGLNPPTLDHGIDVKNGDYAAAYAAKWGIESEVTKSHLKVGKLDSFTPFDFLRIIAQSGYDSSVKAAKILFREYASVFKGKRQLVYSPGLRELYLKEPELSDEDAANGEEKDAEILALIEHSDWKLILKNDQRGQLLEIVNQSLGDWSVAERLIERLRNSLPSLTLDHD